MSHQAAGHAQITYDNLDAFKETLMSDRRALDEENFEEAEQQAFKVTQTSEVSKDTLR